MMTIASKTKNVAVYDKLRQGIIKGKLKPGQKVVMGELAKAFGMSETPVREAIRRLESEGYIDFTPHMGAIVTKIDERELVEIYLIRIALEELATKLEKAMADAPWRARVAAINRALVMQRGDIHVLAEDLLCHFGRCLTEAPALHMR